MKYNSIIVILLIMGFVHCSESYNYVEQGQASYYANLFKGKKTASGEIFTQDSLTAAHRTLPFGTNITITNISNGKSVVVKVNDRGPFIKERIVDVSRRAADSLDFLRHGITEVILQADLSQEQMDSLQTLK